MDTIAEYNQAVCEALHIRAAVEGRLPRGIGVERTRWKVELVAALRYPQHENFVDASIRQFCANANARFQICGDFDAKRQFLVDHVERVIYTGYKITVLGSIPLQTASGQSKLQFRIRGEINKATVCSSWNEKGSNVTRSNSDAGNTT
jgi:hypothetical protein